MLEGAQGFDSSLPDDVFALAISVPPDARRGLRRFTALHYASSRGHWECARLLLTAGASVRATTQDGETPLHLACDGGHWEVARELLDFGAPVEA